VAHALWFGSRSCARLSMSHAVLAAHRMFAGDTADIMGSAASYTNGGDYSSGFKHGMGFITPERVVTLHPQNAPSAAFLLASVDRDQAPGDATLPIPDHVALAARVTVTDPIVAGNTAYLYLSYRATATGKARGVYLTRVSAGWCAHLPPPTTHGCVHVAL